MRKLVTDKTSVKYGVFKARGNEPSRLEQLSDCIFALAITMSLISTAAPKNYGDLVLFVSDLIPFALSVLAVMWIWHVHYQFFMRFGLRDMRIIVLNTLLMVIVLFFVYPLKFLSSWMVGYFTVLFQGLLIDEAYFRQFNEISRNIIPWSKLPLLMIFYSLGFLFIFGIFILMYKHALKKKTELALDDVEIAVSRYLIGHYRGIAVVSIISTAIAATGYVIDWSLSGMFAGVIYFLIGPVIYFVAKKHKIAELEATASTSK